MSGETDGPTLGGIEVTHDPEIPVRLVQLRLCDPCLDGVGGECHTPGCSLWINRAPDLPIRNGVSVRIIVEPETTDGPTLGQVAFAEYYGRQAGAALVMPESWAMQSDAGRADWEAAGAAVAATAIARLGTPAELASAMRENVRLRKQLAALEPKPAPGNAEVAYEQWIEHRNPGDVGSRAGFTAGWQAAVTSASGRPLCPGGCGCRLGTDDADRRECGCDGGCCDGQDWFGVGDADAGTSADPWQVITDVTSELLRGGQTADIRCRAALGVLERAGIDFDGGPVAAASRKPEPARGLTPVEAVRLAVAEDWQPLVDKARAEADHLRELLDEIGVMAANAPEEGDSFGLLEEIAMRIAAVDVPDSTPLDEWPDPENPGTGRTPGTGAAMGVTVNGEPVPRTSGNALAVSPGLGAVMAEATELRAVIDMIWRMCQNPKQAAGTSQGVVVNGDRLAERIAGLIKNSGMEPF